MSNIVGNYINYNINYNNHINYIYDVSPAEELGWVIDRTPEYDSQSLINDGLQIRHDADHDDDLHADDYGANDDFIPFEPQTQHVTHIDILVQQFPLSQEDRYCCVCMETRENQQICQLNCLHKFCSECTLAHIRKNTRQHCCPLCRTNITNISVQTEEIRETFI
jgi:hypothetical protein